MTIEQEFPQYAEPVFRSLTDPDFLIERNLALGELSAEYEVHPGEGRVFIRAVREVKRVLPGMLAKLFDPVNVMDLEENWQSDGDGWDGDWTMRVRGQPVTIRGTFRLEPTADGCRYRVSHRARARIPLVGGQVERYVLSQTIKGAGDELDYLRNYLDQPGT